MAGLLTIGDLAKATDCKVQTIRFYEEIGLLKPFSRTQGNQRRYATDSAKRLRFIRHARDMGFEISDIRELLRLAAMPDAQCRAADVIARRHLDSVRERIKKMRSLEKELVRVVDGCAHKTIAKCRVLEALADHELCCAKKH